MGGTRVGGENLERGAQVGDLSTWRPSQWCDLDRQRKWGLYIEEDDMDGKIYSSLMHILCSMPMSSSGSSVSLDILFRM